MISTIDSAPVQETSPWATEAPSRLGVLLQTTKRAALELALGRRASCARLEDALAFEIHAAAEAAEDLNGLVPAWNGSAEALSASTTLGVRSALAALLEDARAALERDPAANDLAEVILSYPGFEAVAAHRLAHPLSRAGLPLLPRLISETAHRRTGIDLHPGATIGRAFFIDHGTGMVVGETAQIGDDVTLYQGVTLGALSFPRDRHGCIVRGTKRHPTIQSKVTIYSHASVLGGETVIGEGAVIGAGAQVCRSVPAGARVISPLRSHCEGSR